MPATIAVFNDAGHLGEQGVVLAHADVLAGLEAAAALAHDDGTAGNQLPAENLHAQALRIRIAAVLGAS